MWIYFTVIREEGPSRVAPWFMAIPVIGLLGGILLLQEIPSLSQIISITLFVVGGLVLSMTDGKIRLRFVYLGFLMAILLSVHDVIFAKFGRELSGSAAVFMDMLGKSMWGLVLLFGKKTRNGFLIGLQTKLKFQMINEFGVIAGDAITDVAKLIAPVALVQATGCSQSVFVLIGAYVLVRRFPDVFSEELKGSFLSKVIGVVLMTIGGIILAVTL
ncbi:hypothetical protein EB052_01235 [bacterium]|nr:hypothetical protein [bacterium]